jgi:hypothetical protein
LSRLHTAYNNALNGGQPSSILFDNQYASTASASVWLQ